MAKSKKNAALNSPCSRSRMENLRPLLFVNSVPVFSDLVSNLLYDIIEVMKSKKLPLRLQTGFRHVPYLAILSRVGRAACMHGFIKASG
jgi:hypothetical protein